MAGNLLLEEWNMKERKKKNYLKCRYQSVVRLVFRRSLPTPLSPTPRRRRRRRRSCQE